MSLVKVLLATIFICANFYVVHNSHMDNTEMKEKMVTDDVKKANNHFIDGFYTMWDKFVTQPTQQAMQQFGQASTQLQHMTEHLIDMFVKKPIEQMQDMMSH